MTRPQRECLQLQVVTTRFKPRESLIIAKFTNALVRSRPLKEVGAEQVSYGYGSETGLLTFGQVVVRSPGS